MVFDFFKKRRRRKVLEGPFPPEWRDVIRRRCFLYARLDEARRAEHEGLVRIFMAEKAFEGCGGLAIDDEIGVTIAAWATLLLLGRETDVFPRLDSVLVYPTSFRVEHESVVDESGVVVEEEAEMLGESWRTGAIVLSWEDIEEDLAHPADGLNVILHEFAHQLDDETGEGDGTPHLDSGEAIERWHAVMGREYEQHCRAVERGRRTLLDEYGAESPTEFFAVVTEAYFLWPARLKRKHPELHGLLEGYYVSIGPER
jgi:Mlc titration factor MtfA (ptsG expression regulator)